MSLRNLTIGATATALLCIVAPFVVAGFVLLLAFGWAWAVLFGRRTTR